MEQYKLGDMEQRFAEIIWDSEPVTSRVLTELCEKEFNWKRTTTYTMLKRLCEREIFQNQGCTVTSLMSKEEFKTGQGEQFINETFKGSLPQFIAAFTRIKKLSDAEISEIERLISDHREE